MFNLQESLDAYQKALQEFSSNAQQSTKPRTRIVKNTKVTVTKDSIKKSLVDSGIITVKGELINLDIS